MNRFKSSILGFSLLLVIGSIAQPVSSQETKRFHFAVSTPVHYLPIWVAKDMGLYSKHGIDVEVIWIRSGAMATLGIVSGQLPLSGVGAASVVAARAEGADIELLACPLDGDVVYFIARPEIKSPEQLRGKGNRGYAFGHERAFLPAHRLKAAWYGRGQRHDDPATGHRGRDRLGIGVGENRRCHPEFS